MSVQGTCKCGAPVTKLVYADPSVCSPCDNRNADVVKRMAFAVWPLDLQLARVLAICAGADIKHLVMAES
jgi:hypothetical protein